jgi:hypothetical protein
VGEEEKKQRSELYYRESDGGEEVSWRSIHYGRQSHHYPTSTSGKQHRVVEEGSLRFFLCLVATVLAYCEDSTERLSMGALVLWVDGMDHLKDRSDVSKKMSDMGHIQFIYSNSSEWIVLFHHHPSTNFSLSLTSSSLPHPPFGGGGIAPFPIGSPSNIAGHE